MLRERAILLSNWLGRGRLNRFVFLFAFCSLAHHAGGYVFYYVLGWAPASWGHTLIWAFGMAAYFTFLTGRRRVGPPEYPPYHPYSDQ